MTKTYPLLSSSSVLSEVVQNYCQIHQRFDEAEYFLDCDCSIHQEVRIVVQEENFTIPHLSQPVQKEEYGVGHYLLYTHWMGLDHDHLFQKSTDS